METYVIIIFIISIIISFALEKNNKRFIIYSITALKKYFDKKFNIQSIIFKNNFYALKNDLKNYALKDNLQNYALKDDLQNYVLKKDFKQQGQEKLKINNSEKYKILSKIVDAIIKDSKNENTNDELYDIYKPNWYK
jgi:hypothetical protein